MWTFNSRVFPGIDPLVVRKNDRVRIRVGNLTMTNHPVHLHGYDFSVTDSLSFDTYQLAVNCLKVIKQVCTKHGRA